MKTRVLRTTLDLLICLTLLPVFLTGSMQAFASSQPPQDKVETLGLMTQALPTKPDWRNEVITIQPDVSITKQTTGNNFAPGDAITFVLTVANSGNKVATQVVVTDIVPAEVLSPTFASTLTLARTGVITYVWNVEPLAVGESGVIIVNGQIAPNLESDFSFVNIATVSDPEDHTPANNTSRVVVGRYQVYLPLAMKDWQQVIPNAPELNPITNPDGDGNYTVSWNVAYLAETYTLEEDNNAAFSSPATRYTGTGTFWDASGQTRGMYYYRVKASNSRGDGGWSNVQSVIVGPFTPDVPVLNAINNPDNDGNYTVSWNAAYLAESYTLEEDDDAAFPSPTTQYTGTATFWDVSDRTPGTYYYRVKASNSWGDSGWSNTESVTAGSVIPDAPVLNAISNSDRDGSYSVSWNAVYLAETYTLEEDDNRAFFSPTIQYTGAGTSWDASDQVTGTYYYRVKSSNAWGDSPWSNVQSVVAGLFIPDVPVLNAISNPDGDGNYTVIWNVAYLADTYTLEEDNNVAFSSPTIQYTGTAMSWSASEQVTGTYYYRVKASNAWGDSEWSNVQAVMVFPFYYFDDFSNPDSGWPRVSKKVIADPEARYRLNYENGQYRIRLDPGGPDIWFHQPDALAPYRPPSDKYCVETNAKLEKGQDPYQEWDFYPYWANGGLVFGATEDNTKIYAVCFSTDSVGLGWFITSNPVYEYPYTGCAYQGGSAGGGPVGGENAGSLDISKWHRIQVGVDGNHASVYIDGVYKGTWNMSGLNATTWVGLIGGDYEVTPVDFRFDNFKVTPDAACTP